jgi:hypothetical protein
VGSYDEIAMGIQVKEEVKGFFNMSAVTTSVDMLNRLELFAQLERILEMGPDRSSKLLGLPLTSLTLNLKEVMNSATLPC